MDSRQVKQFIRQADKGARVRSINGQKNGAKVTHYIEARGKFEGLLTIRTLALKIIYGMDYDINGRAVAGNIQEKRLTMTPNEWQRVINWYNGLKNA